jgi:hypothetical protein
VTRSEFSIPPIGVASKPPLASHFAGSHSAESRILSQTLPEFMNEHLPKRIGCELRMLHRFSPAGYQTLGQILKRKNPRAAILHHRGIGRSALHFIESKLMEFGIEIPKITIQETPEKRREIKDAKRRDHIEKMIQKLEARVLKYKSQLTPTPKLNESWERGGVGR